MNSGFVFAFKLKKTKKKLYFDHQILCILIWMKPKIFFSNEKKASCEAFEKKMGAKAKRKNRITIFQSCSYTHTHWIDENNEKKNEKKIEYNRIEHTHKKIFINKQREKKWIQNFQCNGNSNMIIIQSLMMIIRFFSFWFDHQIT